MWLQSYTYMVAEIHKLGVRHDWYPGEKLQDFVVWVGLGGPPALLLFLSEQHQPSDNVGRHNVKITKEIREE